jgi:hypothetical protein
VQNGQSNLVRGALYALATAALLATQASLSLLGAKRLSVAEFIGVTELVLLLCVPFMLRTQRSREHFRTLNFVSLEPWQVRRAASDRADGYRALRV